MIKALAFAVVALTACTTIDDGSQPIAPVDAIEPALHASTLPGGLEPDAACACETYDCVVEWVDTNIGCGLCVDLVCAGGRRLGACAVCDG